MSEIFSKVEDCYFLAKRLIKKLGNKIEFDGAIRTATPSGKYLSSYRRNNKEYMFNGQWVPFYFKFSDKEFLRIGVGSNYLKGSSFGERMAVLSDFYEVLSEEYGEPTVFYTTKNDDEKLISLQWSFVNKKEEIKRFKSGTYFDDAEIETLIIIGEDKNIGGRLRNETKKCLSMGIGLPFELIYLVDSDLENFVMHKRGKELTIPVGAKVDGVPVTSFEKKLKKNITRNNI